MKMNQLPPLLIFNTCPNQETADAIASALVDEQLAACVNILPGVQSVYRWQGKMEKATELLLIIKARADALNDIKTRIVELHPYELPEVIAVPIGDGLKQYLEWINNPDKSNA